MGAKAPSYLKLYHSKNIISNKRNTLTVFSLVAVVIMVSIYIFNDVLTKEKHNFLEPVTIVLTLILILKTIQLIFIWIKNEVK